MPRRQQSAEETTHVEFLESLDRVNRAMQGTRRLDEMLHDVLDETLSIFACDRAWLLYPCDPDALTWHVPMECTRPEYPGAFALGVERPVDATVAEAFRAVLDTDGPVAYGPDALRPVPDVPAQEFQVQSMLAMAI